MSPSYFTAKRDGSIAVRLNDEGHAFVTALATAVVAAERDPEHQWHLSLNPIINPAKDLDDPLAILQRQKDTLTNAELTVACASSDVLTKGEAWAWLTTLQVALRATAAERGIRHNDDWKTAPHETRDLVESIQALLAGLADVLQKE
jgi:hypothetical protein